MPVHKSYLAAMHVAVKNVRFKRRKGLVDTVGGEAMTSDSIRLICEDRRVARAIRLASQDLSKRRTVVEIASAAGLSRTHFARRFRFMMGISFAEWSTVIRIKEAKELLKVVDLSITGVGAAVGYSDVTTFARVFRKYEFMSPREYRKTLLGLRKEIGQEPSQVKFADSGAQFADFEVRSAETAQRISLDTE